MLLILQLLGSIGLFMYGMKIMSEALQKAAGIGLRRNLSAIARNKYKGILSGGIITAGIQSSTATSIMVVSFVNAGLLTLTESTGLIMGANIGTTITAWLVAIFGFKLNMSTITIPLIGASFPFYFSKNKYLRYWAEFIIGFALIFIGLDFIKGVFPDIDTNPQFLDFVTNITQRGFISLILFLMLGLVITSIIQSSSVASALTIVLCVKGWIGFEHATAMVLGENIGTTVSANVAAIMANKTARRAALWHTLFNLSGVIWCLPLIKVFAQLIDSIMVKSGNLSPYLETASIPVSLAIFHSGFNIFNTLILSGFAKYITILTGKIINHKDEKESFGLKFLTPGFMSTSELSLIQVQNEVALFGKRTGKMFDRIVQLFAETNHANFQGIYKNIKTNEQQSDNLEEEIATYLTRLSEGELTQESSFKIRIMLKIVDELEIICDALFKLAKSLKKKRKNKIWFTQNIRNNMNAMFKLLEEAFQKMNQNLSDDYGRVDLEGALIIEKKINKYRKELHKEHVNNVEKQSYKYEAGFMYNDLFNRCERLGDYVCNISKIMSEVG